jgi:hypothetical protein
MESASTTDDGSTEVAQRKRHNDVIVYENKTFNSLRYQNKLEYRFVFRFNPRGTAKMLEDLQFKVTQGERDVLQA